MLPPDWLSLERERQLMALGVDWRPDRGAAERMWDARLTQLLAFHRQHGHLQVGGRFPAAATQPDRRAEDSLLHLHLLLQSRDPA